MDEKDIKLKDIDFSYDAFFSEQFLIESYANDIPFCYNPQLKEAFSKIITDESDTCVCIFNFLVSRGWEKKGKAEKKDIATAKENFVQK